MVLWLALAFLEFLQATQYATRTVADVIRIHRQQHAERLLNQACQMILQTRDLAEVQARFTFAPAPT